MTPHDNLVFAAGVLACSMFVNGWSSRAGRGVAMVLGLGLFATALFRLPL
jgi:hypothetical protein